MNNKKETIIKARNLKKSFVTGDTRAENSLQYI